MNLSIRSDVLIEEHPALTIHISERAPRPIGTEDGFLLDITIRNSLPLVGTFESPAPIRQVTFVQDLPVDEVKVGLVGLEAEIMVFTTIENITLKPGTTSVTLRCTVSIGTPFFSRPLIVSVTVIWLICS